MAQPEIEQARLEGALLVGRTAAHLLNNALMLVVGYAELLQLNPEITANPTLSANAQSISQAAQDAAKIVSDLPNLQRLVEIPSPLGPDKPILDLQASIRPEDSTSADK